MDCIAAYIKALLYKESLEDKKSLIDKIQSSKND